jgi:hypothetical protein
MRFVCHRFRKLGCPQTALADIGFIGLTPSASVLGDRPASPAVGRDRPVMPIQALGIGNVQLAMLTEKTKASNQSGRPFHCSTNANAVTNG